MARTRVIQNSPLQVMGHHPLNPLIAPRPVAPAPPVNPLTSAAEVPVDDRPFQPEANTGDDAWAKEVERRERGEGIKRKDVLVTPPSFAVAENLTGRGLVTSTLHAPASAVLTSLPDRFALEIERKPDGWWKVTAPSVHVGIFVANKDLRAALADAPDSMAKILQLDGPMPQQRRGKRRNA